MTDADADAQVEKTANSAREVSPSWTPARQQQSNWAVMARIERGGRRRPVAAIALASAAAAALGVYAWAWVRPARSLAPAAAAVASVNARSFGSTPSILADGSRIVIDDPDTVLRKTVEQEDEVLFELEAGGAHFEVARRPSRLFRVHAGPVTIEVVGTGFLVQRKAARCFVAVQHGRVRVSWWGGSRELGPGEEGTFPPDASAASETAPAAADTARAPARKPSRASSPEVPDVLFRRADQARSDGKIDTAVALLRELVERYPRDGHAAAAAFTLGRLLLESSNRPREAAVAFARAGVLAGNDGAVVEDALAREVEALHAAGDLSEAHTRAERYVALFPNGLHRQTVARFGGLQRDR